VRNTNSSLAAKFSVRLGVGHVYKFLWLGIGKLPSWQWQYGNKSILLHYSTILEWRH